MTSERDKFIALIDSGIKNEEVKELLLMAYDLDDLEYKIEGNKFMFRLKSEREN